MSELPAPLVPADVDLRDVPIPWETFAQMGVLEFGLTIEEARALVAECADRQAKRRVRRGRRFPQ